MTEMPGRIEWEPYVENPDRPSEKYIWNKCHDQWLAYHVEVLESLKLTDHYKRKVTTRYVNARIQQAIERVRGTYEKK